MSLCFFVRCKPQGSDLIELVKSTKRVFIGYPPWRKGGRDSYNPNNIRASIIDVSTEDLTDIDLNVLSKSYRKQVKANHNLVREVNSNPGSLVLVPRPELGVCYIGRVASFELVDQPTWINDYRTLRERQEVRITKGKCDVWNDEWNHTGDIVQTFDVGDSLCEIPFFAIPGWVRHQLFGRATCGRIKSIIPSQNPFETLTQVYKSGDRSIDLTPTDEPEEIANRLLNFVTPGIFEHLVCELLQLDRAEEYWWHVGGPGDGGVDGLAFDQAGGILGAVQCKLACSSGPYLLGLGKDMRAAFPHRNVLIFVFSLYTDIETIVDDGIRVYGRKGIIELLLKHRQESSFAAMLGLR